MAKSKYKEDFPLLAEGLAREGLIDEQIAKKLGISKDTFYQYVKKYPDFSDALKAGKAPVDFEVENKLLQRARGYRYKEVKQIGITSPVEIEKAKKKGIEAKNVILRQEITEKEVVPDVTAQIFWLKNRKPDIWRDKHDHNISGGINFSIEDVHDLLNDDEEESNTD